MLSFHCRKSILGGGRLDRVSISSVVSWTGFRVDGKSMENSTAWPSTRFVVVPGGSPMRLLSLAYDLTQR